MHSLPHTLQTLPGDSDILLNGLVLDFVIKSPVRMHLKNSECPLLTEPILAELRKSGINTVLAFLSRDSETLIHVCSLTYQEAVSVKKVLLAKYSALPHPLDEILDEAPIAHLPLGCESLDGLLGGGLSAGDLVELCGPFAVGKTQLCMAAAAAALAAGARVIFADTKGEFSSARCRQILHHRRVPHSECDRMLDRMQYAACSTVRDLLSLLEVVRSRRRLHAGLRLLVVDSLAALVAPLLASPGFVGFGLLNFLGTTLKSLAADCRLTVVVTNHVVQNESGAAPGVHPALGLGWLPVPHVRLLLHREVAANHASEPQFCLYGPRRTAILTKSVSSACGGSAEFLVTPSGIEDPVCLRNEDLMS
ncbi:DNA repair protein RAD51 homolog 4-like isoform X2 [Pollicipes pollicipes]|uniref:DNA repair protein RAD51 homolog 4-like isoform X2 n=1 Tax=Pollicipes pollicipes TaxID=41117 RepID=UPI0018856EE8|nr:DNA repair protein RAD51 homolog 4-like isoform X2 [Pollicipes pollicipes]